MTIATRVLTSRHIVLAALAVAMCAAPVASADDREMGDGHLLPPDARVDGLTAGQVMGEAWYRNLTLPVAENPLFGNGEQCARLGLNGKVLLAIGFQPCTVPEGTTVYIIGITNFCDNVEPEPYFGADEAAQRKCAMVTLAPFVESIQLTVDGGEPVDLQTRRYEIFSPQRHVQLLADNFLALTMEGRGETLLGTEAVFDDGGVHTWDLVVNVVADDHGEDDD